MEKLKKAKKLIITLLFLVTMLLCTSNVFASTYSENRTIDTQKNNITLSGNYPYLRNIDSNALQININKIITISLNEKFDEISQIPKNINVSYDCIVENEYLSIVLYFENLGTGEIEVKSINANINEGYFFDIIDVLGINAMEYVNKVLLTEIPKQGISYKKIDDNTPFYVKDGFVYAIFGAGEVSLPQKGNILIPISISNINNYLLPENMYFTKSEYNVKMIPLRNALQNFGFELVWDGNSSMVSIFRNDSLISYVQIGSTRYFKSNGNSKILEFAPELSYGTTYVPISFFTDVLDMLVDIDEENNIIFSEYKS